MFLFWILAAVICFVIELMTVTLVSIWFVLGAIAALFAAVLGASTAVQWVVFVVVSLLGLVLLRRFWTKKFNTKFTATNSDRFVGETAVVEEEIDSVRGEGRVLVRGQSWSAKLEEGTEGIIPKDCPVKVLRIEGAKLVVQPEAPEEDHSAEAAKQM